MKRLCDNLKGLLKKCCAPRQQTWVNGEDPTWRRKAAGRGHSPSPAPAAMPTGSEGLALPLVTAMPRGAGPWSWAVQVKTWPGVRVGTFTKPLPSPPVRLWTESWKIPRRIRNKPASDFCVCGAVCLRPKAIQAVLAEALQWELLAKSSFLGTDWILLS